MTTPPVEVKRESVEVKKAPPVLAVEAAPEPPTEMGDISAPVTFPDEKIEDVERTLAQMSVEKKVAQVFIFGFAGTTVQPELRSLLQEMTPGGLIVFKRNIKTLEQTYQLNSETQRLSLSAAGVPLLLMVDQEGGSVTRLQTSPPPPSGLALGQTGREDLAERVGFLAGQLLRQVGFNMNLAPVMDLSDPYEESFIGNRSFGNDPKQVWKMTRAYSVGLLKAGVLPTGKHYPGHGGVASDSHRELPEKDASLTELMKEDLGPFAYLSSSEKFSALMVAHIAFPSIDPSGAPATFSKVLVEDVLKKQLKYQGLVITDDIEMDGAEAGGDIQERAVKAFEAGCDMIMVAWSKTRQKNAYEGLLTAVKRGQISEERLNQSVRKILLTKKLLAGDRELKNYPLEKNFPITEVKTVMTETRNVSHEITKVHFQQAFLNQPQLLESPLAARSVYVFSADKIFSQSFLNQFRAVKASPVPLTQQSPDLLKRYLERDKSSIAVFYVSGTGTARHVSRLPTKLKQRTILVNSTAPGLIKGADEFLGVFHIYTHQPYSGGMLGKIMNRMFEGEQRQPAEAITPAKKTK